ncbi:PH domain-containing protein [Catalinimonas alkaloidigena]|uniref:PH domain-containing protein n=1 Tax=Catalinimonas alkaloidigena TaxID=1075417 RepID=A0A1G9RQ22_9BACT|nr:PH domain-containing protein [Catalinimonas alkaloidigena]SDM25459.1 PH domain-containing protein [Catalinimonas alkaloidigena]
MKKVYTSQKGEIVSIVLWVPLLGMLGFSLWDGKWVMALIMIATCALTAVVWYGTRYQIVGEMLVVKVGPLTTSTLPISRIREIRRTQTLLAAPANSLDRLEIRYNRYDMLVVSPERPDAFVADLQRINPHIRWVAPNEVWEHAMN